MLRMASAMQGLGGASPFGSPFGAPQAPAFPAPGTPTTAAGQAGATTTPAPATGSPPVNPFALFNPTVGAGAPGATGTGTEVAAGTNAGAAQPFGFNPALMQQMLGMGGPFGGGAGAGGLGAYGGFGGFGGAEATPAVPADTRSPEERFQVQLQVCFLFVVRVYRTDGGCSNYKTWGSRTQHRTCARCSRRAEMCRVRSTTYSAVEGYKQSDGLLVILDDNCSAYIW